MAQLARLPRHFTEQETLDDFLQSMGRLRRTAQQVRSLEARIDIELSRARDSSPPAKPHDDLLYDP